ncbi:MAG: hypothetical protein AAF604_07780 [Acidobacteriota bacterium]
MPPASADGELSSRTTGESLGLRMAAPMRAMDLPAGVAADAWESFRLTQGLSPKAAERAVFDRRTGRPLVIELSVPWIPGAGNSLAAAKGIDTLPELERLGREWIDRHADLAGITSAELVLDEKASQGVGPLAGAEGDPRYRLWHVVFRWQPHGLPVDGARVVFRVNHGNLIHWEMENISSSLEVPKAAVPEVLVDAQQSRKALAEYLGGEKAGDLYYKDGDLRLIPTSPSLVVGDGPPVYIGTFGRGLEYRLVREHSFQRAGDSEVWEGLVDAYTGAVVSFRGTAVDAVARGRVRPHGSLTSEVNQNFPWVDYRQSPVQFADENGIFTSGVPNRSFMRGEQVEMDDVCGTIDFNTGVGNLDFGGASNPLTNDCNSTAGPTDGNTSASRTSYFWANDGLKRAREFMPNLDWSAGSASGPLTIEVNRDTGLCLGQYFDLPNHKIEMTRDVARCNNAGENVTHLLHELGHAIDFTDGSHPGTDGGSGEGYADIVAALHVEDSCIARGAEYADGCGAFQNYDCSATCDGFRDIDWRTHKGMVPHTPQTNLACGSGHPSWQGPCGRQPHCETAPGTESIWDLVQELILAGYSSAQAFDKVEELFYSSRPSAGSFFTCQFATTTREGGNVAGSLYHTLRAQDDCDGDPGNGTPHAAAIFTALARHEIAVGSASDPANQNNDCSASITVDEPLGGDTWPVGGGRFIRWTSDGITGNVRISLSRNGGAFQTLFTSTPDDGGQFWIVTGPLANTAVMRVASVSDPTVFGDSAPFAITVAGFVINNTGDAGDNNLGDNACATSGGVCTLRAALQQSNASLGRQRLTFALPSGNTFQPASALPVVTDPVQIEGISQTPQGLVEIDGSAAGTNVIGLDITAGDSEVNGLVINRFDNAGLRLNGGSGNIVLMNRIGTDQAGLVDLGNGMAGIQITNSSGNSIGGLRPGGGNVLSGNEWGIRLSGVGARDNFIFGNSIGTSIFNQGPLGNTRHGIVIVSGANRNTIADGVPRGVIIRDATANTIAYNGFDGIAVLDGVQNDIYANRIHDNGGLGIDLANDGVTPNDPGDPDVGPNNLQNFPVITSVVVGSSDTTVTGTLDLGPGGIDTGFVVDVYVSDVCDPSGHGEGKWHSKPFTLNTDPLGNWTMVLHTLVSPGDVITATATRSRSTSEFSACFTVPLRRGQFDR